MHIRARRKVSKVYASSLWRRLSGRVRRRARGACEQCGEPARRLEVHHVDAIGDGGDPFPHVRQLIALCAHCHGLRHGRVSTSRREWRRHVADAIPAEPEPAIIGGFY